MSSIVRVYLVVVGDVGSNLSSRSNFASTIGAGNCIADSRSLDSAIKVGNDYVVVPSLCSNIVLLIVELDLASIGAGLQIALNDVVNLGVAGYIDTKDGVLSVRLVLGTSVAVLEQYGNFLANILVVEVSLELCSYSRNLRSAVGNSLVLTIDRALTVSRHP